MSKRTLTGTVVSAKMNNTVVVSVEMPKKHPLYEKTVKNTRRFKAHTDNKVDEGKMVVIEESRPYSKEVSWKVIGEVKE